MRQKILVIRADEFRHKALSHSIKENGFVIHEIIEKKAQRKIPYTSDLMNLHFELRRQTELKYFSELVCKTELKEYEQLVTHDINNSTALSFSQNFNPDLVITFGCSILTPYWIKIFGNRILGIHLGLSPYYRGSGTNFFPFVNNELGAVGYSLMKLNEGIDTGDIIHQAYASFEPNDDIHIVGTRLIKKMLDDILKLIKISDLKSQFELAKKQPRIENSRIYRRKDFTVETLTKALRNIENNSVGDYLKNTILEQNKFPLIRQIT